jgi:hypothetical protein
MPRVCTVCRHPDLEAIDKALVAGEPLRNIAERTGTSATALFRHKADHIPALLVKAQEAGEVARADSLLDHLLNLLAKAMDILTKAGKAGDLRTALMAIREARSTLEVVGKVTGELVTKVEHGGSVDHHVLPGFSDEQLRALVAKAEHLALEQGLTVIDGEIVGD